MSDEFDEGLEPMTPRDRASARAGTPSPRLVARLFAAAGNPLRVRLLRCLMRPLTGCNKSTKFCGKQALNVTLCRSQIICG